MAANGPGCGGTRACIVDRPARAGMATLMRGNLDRRVTSRMTGTSSTKPISKNIGRPMTAPMRAIAHGRVAGDALDTSVSTISSAPPESASNLPMIAPRAMRTPTDATVDPTPVE